ncbi:Fatty acid-binding protein [Halotydeus destructor]|nr:Fatty acid-binding protein [Halotydeus destructor]
MSAVGTYKLIKTENFDGLLRELGVSAAQAAVADKVIPTVTVSQDGDNWTLKIDSTFEASSVTFQLGQEFDELRQDGVAVKSTVTQDGNKWIQVQKGDKEVTIVREFTEEGFTVTTTVNGVTSVRHYQRQ